MCVCVRACVRAYVRACMCVCVCVSELYSAVQVVWDQHHIQVKHCVTIVS